jgi:phospholipid/cholesterol/gamma-HCH transport system substrate-binding protein
LERDAKYAAVALFALACIAAALAFVWWYSGRGDRRDFDTYEIYFEGSVSGLSKGSPVRYLGVDVGRVTALAVDKRDAARVKVVADIDRSAPISGATQAKLGLLGLTGLLYIDLQQDPKVPPTEPLVRGDAHPVIAARKGTIEASIEKLPEILNQATSIMARIEQMLDDENIAKFDRTLANIERSSATLPETLADARALAADLHRISASTLALTERLNSTLAESQPELRATLANARAASEKLVRTAEGLDRFINANDGSLARGAAASLGELQQLAIDAREASNEIRSLARELRERPSSLVFERPEAGVEMPR